MIRILGRRSNKRVVITVSSMSWDVRLKEDFCLTGKFSVQLGLSEPWVGRGAVELAIATSFSRRQLLLWFEFLFHSLTATPHYNNPDYREEERVPVDSTVSWDENFTFQRYKIERKISLFSFLLWDYFFIIPTCLWFISLIKQTMQLLTRFLQGAAIRWSSATIPAPLTRTTFQDYKIPSYFDRVNFLILENNLLSVKPPHLWMANKGSTTTVRRWFSWNFHDGKIALW